MVVMIVEESVLIVNTSRKRMNMIIVLLVSYEIKSGKM